MLMQYVLATCSCSMDKVMRHGHGRATWTWKRSMNTDMDIHIVLDMAMFIDYIFWDRQVSRQWRESSYWFTWTFTLWAFAELQSCNSVWLRRTFCIITSSRKIREARKFCVATSRRNWKIP
jgi:hypothetical protein